MYDDIWRRNLEMSESEQSEVRAVEMSFLKATSGITTMDRMTEKTMYEHVSQREIQMPFQHGHPPAGGATCRR